jgi:hypothetical protein
MANQEDVRRIATRLPGAVESPDHFAFSVLSKGKAKGFIWSWAERVQPKKARVPNASVLAVLVQNLDVKEILLSSDEQKFFTEPHYTDFPAILVRLEAIEADELEDLIIEAWQCKASPELRRQFDRR